MVGIPHGFIVIPVIRIGSVKMLNASKEYICKSSKCNHRFRVYADIEQGNILQPPKACPMAQVRISFWMDGCIVSRLGEQERY